jgi:hypothetical protein
LNFNQNSEDQNLDLKLTGKSLELKRVHCSHWAESGRPKSHWAWSIQTKTGEHFLGGWPAAMRLAATRVGRGLVLAPHGDTGNPFWELGRRNLTVGGGPRRRTSVGGRCRGGSDGLVDSAARADAEVQGACGASTTA